MKSEKMMIRGAAFALTAAILAGALSGCMDRSDTKTPASNGGESVTPDVTSGTADEPEVTTGTTATNDPETSADEAGSNEPAAPGDETAAADSDFSPIGEIIISEEEEAELKRAGFSVIGNQIVPADEKIAAAHHFDRYYGTYNGYAVLLEGGMLTALSELKVAGQVFRSNYSFSIYAYKNGELHTISEAYESGLLTADDIAAIAAKHNSLGQGGYEVE